MQYHLLYNAAAHFAAQDKYPYGLVKEITKPGMEGFYAVCWALAKLSEQAELARRHLGYDHQKPVEEDELRLTLRPNEMIAAKTAIFQAVSKGLGDPKEGEVDEVLLELQKKTGEN